MGGSQASGQEKPDKLLEEVRHLIHGLERISADSRWARRSSGYRGALLKQLDWLENETAPPQDNLAHLQELVEVGYAMLIKAAREIQVEER